MNTACLCNLVLVFVLLFTGRPAPAGVKSFFHRTDPRTAAESDDQTSPTMSKSGRPLALPPDCTRKGCNAAEWQRFVESHHSTPSWLIYKTLIHTLVDEKKFRDKRREVLKPSAEKSKEITKKCETGSLGERITCLRTRVQEYLADSKNAPEGDKADCEAYAYTLEAVLKEAFKDQPDLNFGLIAYSNHALIEMTYKDPKSGRTYVYHLDSGIDKGRYTDLHPSNLTAIRQDLPVALKGSSKR